MREQLINASIKHFEAHIEKHRINTEILFKSTVGVAEHPDVMETIEKELEKIADYHDKLEVLKTYFIKENEKEVLNG
tara:strand:+ start:544 stop:774 length:231 start_codon:yes stop_codon:yes gene_type:complete